MPCLSREAVYTNVIVILTCVGLKTTTYQFWGEYENNFTIDAVIIGGYDKV